MPIRTYSRSSTTSASCSCLSTACSGIRSLGTARGAPASGPGLAGVACSRSRERACLSGDAAGTRRFSGFSTKLDSCRNDSPGALPVALPTARLNSSPCDPPDMMLGSTRRCGVASRPSSPDRRARRGLATGVSSAGASSARRSSPRARSCAPAAGERGSPAPLGSPSSGTRIALRVECCTAESRRRYCQLSASAREMPTPRTRSKSRELRSAPLRRGSARPGVIGIDRAARCADGGALSWPDIGGVGGGGATRRRAVLIGT